MLFFPVHESVARIPTLDPPTMMVCSDSVTGSPEVNTNVGPYLNSTPPSTSAMEGNGKHGSSHKSGKGYH